MAARMMGRCGVAAAKGLLALLLPIGAHAQANSTPAPQTLITAFPASGDMPPAPWHVAGLPHQKKPFTRFALVDVDGRRALRVQADESYGNLVHPFVHAPPAQHLVWQWRVDQLLAGANLHEKSGDDTALKVCVFFDLPLDQVPFLERQLLRFARAQTTEPLPAATVCYVWDSHLAEGTVVENAFTRRVRYLVLQTGPAQPHQWAHERRDMGADFMQLFGAESPQVPPIVGVAIGADADNTHGHSLGHVAGLVLEP
jgi:Protein of unknown function (DUF3047)